MELELKSNNFTYNEICPACGNWHDDAEIPHWLFVKGTQHGVCRQCAEKHAPGLLADVKHSREKFWNHNKQNV